LREFLIVAHFLFDSEKDLLEGTFWLPPLQDSKVLDITIALVDAGDVDFIIELDLGSLLRIVRATGDRETVNPIFKDSLNEIIEYVVGAQDGSIPVGQGHVVGYVKIWYYIGPVRNWRSYLRVLSLPFRALQGVWIFWRRLQLEILLLVMLPDIIWWITKKI
jgi:hypothetical protein